MLENFLTRFCWQRENPQSVFDVVDYYAIILDVRHGNRISNAIVLRRKMDKSCVVAVTCTKKRDPNYIICKSREPVKIDK